MRVAVVEARCAIYTVGRNYRIRPRRTAPRPERPLVYGKAPIIGRRRTARR